jgi:hypothetical protein
MFSSWVDSSLRVYSTSADASDGRYRMEEAISEVRFPGVPSRIIDRELASIDLMVFMSSSAAASTSSTSSFFSISSFSSIGGSRPSRCSSSMSSSTF